MSTSALVSRDNPVVEGQVLPFGLPQGTLAANVQTGDAFESETCDTAVAVVVGKSEDKALHAELANRSHSAERPGMGPAADAGFDPRPGKVTSGVNPTYARASEKQLFLEVRRRGLKTPGNLEKYNLHFYSTRKVSRYQCRRAHGAMRQCPSLSDPLLCMMLAQGGLKRLRSEVTATLRRSDAGTLTPADMPGATDIAERASGLEYIPHGHMVCASVLMVLGGFYTCTFTTPCISCTHLWVDGFTRSELCL